jgi:hypothetical protein
VSAILKRMRVPVTTRQIASRNRRAAKPLLFCAMALGLAVARAQPFPAFLLDTTVVIGPDAEEADWTGVAFGNQRGLVVWTDGDLVKGCRFTRSLVPLDAPGLPLSRVMSVGVPRVDVAWSRDTFLAVWADDYGYGHVTVGALVSEGDTAVRRVILDSSYMTHSRPVVAANDSEFLVAWTEDTLGGKSRVRYERVSRSGVVPDTATRTVAVPEGDQGAAAVAWGDTSYMVVWIGGGLTLNCNIIRSDGTRASDYGYRITFDRALSAPVVSFDGRSFIVMWVRSADRSFGPTDELRVVRVTQEGVVTDSASVAADPGEMNYRWYGVASVLDTTLLAWEAWRDNAWCAFGVRLDSSLRTLDSIPIVLATPVEGDHSDDLAPAGISCATIGDTFIVSWAGWLGPVDWPNSERDVVCRRVTPDGVLPETAAVVMSYSAGAQFAPVVASDGTDFMAAWEELRADETLYDTYVYCCRFSSSGAVLDSAPKCLAGTGAGGPIICHGGGYYLALWGDGDQGPSPRVLAARLDSDGTLIDTAPIVVRGAYGATGAAYADSVFLVAMTHGGRVHCMRLSSSGTVLDSVPFQLPGSDTRLNPGVASDGDSTFIVTQYCPEPYDDDSVSIVRVTSGGVILDSVEVMLGPVAGSTIPRVYPAPVRGPGEYFVVATTSTGPPAAWRVSYAGIVIDTVEDVYLFGMATQAVYDGANYLVANGCSAARIGAQRIGPDGAVIDYFPVEVVSIDTTSSRFSTGARTATNDEGVTAAVFGTYEPQRYGSKRIRAGVWAPLGVAVENRVAPLRRVSIHPNPVAGTAMLEVGGSNTGPLSVTLYDVQGRFVKLLADVPAGMGRNRIPLDIRGIPAGIYFVNVRPTGVRTKLVVVTM